MRMLLANWLRSSGMHDKNNGHNLSHLKKDCFSDTSPSSVSSDSKKPISLNASVASAFDLKRNCSKIQIIFRIHFCIVYIVFLLKFERINPSRNNGICSSNCNFVILQMRWQQFHQAQCTIFDAKP